MFRYYNEYHLICQVKDWFLLEALTQKAIEIYKARIAKNYEQVVDLSEELNYFVIEASLRGYNVTSTIQWAYGRTKAYVKDEVLSEYKSHVYNHVEDDNDFGFEFFGSHWEFWK